MKIKNLVLILLLLVVSTSAQKQYTINGTTPEKYNNRYVYITQLTIDGPINEPPKFTDSVIVKNGQFVFKGALGDEILLYSISLGKTTGSFIALDTTELTAEYIDRDPIGYFRISGTMLNEKLTDFTEYPSILLQKISNAMENREELLAKNEWGEENQSKFNLNMMIDASHYLDLASKLVLNNINNPVGQYILVMFGGMINKEVMDKIDPQLSEVVKQRVEASRISITQNMSHISDSIPELVKQGTKYVDFEGETLLGNKTRLSLVIKSKKLVLIDFWASWCAPCLKEMPEIRDLYDNYKDKGLEVVGVSLDKDRQEWRNKVKDKNMTWVQFIDFNVSNSIAKIYGVKTIPHTVLIDENGIIIANKLRGKELKVKIETLLSEYNLVAYE